MIFTIHFGGNTPIFGNTKNTYQGYSFVTYVSYSFFKNFPNL